MKKEHEEFHKHPEKFIPVDEIGDLCLQWFYDRYAALRMLKNMKIFNRAYDLLTKKGNFSRENSFGEMHCDGYLWIEPCKDVRVIVEERQSYSYVYIQTKYSFHIRELDFKMNYPDYRKNMLKGITIEKFKKQGFEPYCPQNYNSKRFSAFTYGDSRDIGYILSLNNILPDFTRVENANQRTIRAIDSLAYWEVYLDNSEELE